MRPSWISVFVFAVGLGLIFGAPTASRWSWYGEWSPASAALVGIAAFLIVLLEYVERAVRLLADISERLSTPEVSR